MTTTLSLLGDPAGWKDAQIHLSALQALWGGWQVFLSGDGTAVVRHVSPVRREQRYKLTLTPDEVHTLFAACVENDLLSIPALQRPGHPDETMLELTLVNGRGERRTVKKWAGERQAAFETVSRPLFALTARLQEMIPFYTGPFEWPKPSEGVSTRIETGFLLFW